MSTARYWCNGSQLVRFWTAKLILAAVELVRSQLWSTSNQYQSQDCLSTIAKTESGSYTQDGHCYQTKVPVSLAAQGHHQEYVGPEREKLVVANS